MQIRIDDEVTVSKDDAMIIEGSDFRLIDANDYYYHLDNQTEGDTS